MKKIFQGLEACREVEAIAAGWSADKKYCVTAEDGKKYFLRLSPLFTFEQQQTQFSMMEKAAELKTPMCLPIEFGIHNEEVYALHSWINGRDLDENLLNLSEVEQYKLGWISGEFLQKIHMIPVQKELTDWAVRFNCKTDRRIDQYQACGIRFEGDVIILDHLQKHRSLLDNRPQCFQYGDYHIGNMMLEKKELKIIDFDRFDFGDPWEEFNRIIWSVSVSPYFATGQLRGYFNGEPPLKFFDLLQFYIASNTISAISWAVPYGEASIETMKKQAVDILVWFDNFESSIPTWYLDDFRP